MIIAFGSDERTALTAALLDALRARGHEVLPFGAVAGSGEPWPGVGRSVGYAVVRGNADMGIVCCWTGTGVSIAANKVTGVRAALCTDAQTASGARRWNDANVLALSNRATSIPVALEILDAWFSTAPSADPADQQAVGDIENVTVLQHIGSTGAPPTPAGAT
jgi:ribose 5-phosphate isomerase B